MLNRTLGGLTKDDERRRGFRLPVREYRDLLKTYMKRQLGSITVLGALVAAGIVLQLANPQLLRRFLDLATSRAPIAELYRYAVLFLGIAITIRLVRALNGFLSRKIAWRSTNSLRFDLVRHILGLDMKFHTEHAPGELIERIDGDIELLSHFFSDFALRLAANGIYAVGVLVMLYLEDWRIGVPFTAYTIALVLILGALRNLAIPPRKKFQADMAEHSSFLEESLSSLEDIRSVSAGAYFRNRFIEIIRSLYRTGLRSALSGQVMVNTAQFMFALGTALACGIGSLLFVHRGISVGTVYLVLQYATMLVSPLQQISSELQTLQSSGAAISRTKELLDESCGIVSGSSEAVFEGRDIVFEQVSFSYIPERQVLGNVSFTMPSGTVTGLVGRTGSGKTTISRLLFRFYDPDTGRIRIGETDMRSCSVESIRRNTGLVTQDVRLFSASIEENITMFDPDVSRSRVLETLDLLGIRSWVDSLPKGLDTIIGASGHGLSSGEAQLVAFARVFMRDPSVIVLDEASARLDPATERIIESAIDRLFLGRTGLIIAHRLSTIDRVDSLIVMEHGAIVETGSPRILRLNPDSRFSRLLRSAEEGSA